MEEIEDDCKPANYVYVTRFSAIHQSGSKRCEAVLLTEGESMRSVVMMNWGKVEEIGQFKDKFFDDPFPAGALFYAKVHQKRSSGYDERVEYQDTIAVQKSDLPKYMSLDMLAHARGIGAPGLPGSIRGAEVHAWDDGEADLVETAVEPAKLAHDYSADKEWGMF